MLESCSKPLMKSSFIIFQQCAYTALQFLQRIEEIEIDCDSVDKQRVVLRKLWRKMNRLVNDRCDDALGSNLKKTTKQLIQSLSIHKKWCSMI